MNIKVVYHIGSLYGGHLAYSNYLVKGLKQLGHNVQYLLLSHNKKPANYKEKLQYITTNNGVYDKVASPRHYNFFQSIGTYGHMIDGFLMNTYCYRDPKVFQQIVSKLDQSQLVIWQDIGNFNQKPLRDSGDTSWLKLFKRNNPNTKQIACIHDGNLYSRYPYLASVMHHFDAFIGVHPASFNIASNVGKPMHLIVNPQDLSKVDKTKSGYKNKDKKTLLALGTWKASKRFQDIVKAVPWIDKDTVIDIIGQGIERAYLSTVNKDKVKPQYVITTDTDPDINQHPMKLENDKLKDGVLSRAKRWNPNFKLSDVINEQQRDQYFSNTFLYIEPAWYKINFQIDAHFSRVLIQGMMNGVVPIARNLGLSNNIEGNGTFFKAGQNYIMIPYDSTNKQFGDAVNAALNISQEQYDRIVENNYKLLQQFNYLNVAQRFVELGNGIIDNIELIQNSGNVSEEKYKKLKEHCYKILCQDTPKGFRLPQSAIDQLQKDDYIRMPK